MNKRKVVWGSETTEDFGTILQQQEWSYDNKRALQDTKRRANHWNSAKMPKMQKRVYDEPEAVSSRQVSRMLCVRYGYTIRYGTRGKASEANKRHWDVNTRGVWRVFVWISILDWLCPSQTESWTLGCGTELEIRFGIQFLFLFVEFISTVTPNYLRTTKRFIYIRLWSTFSSCHLITTMGESREERLS